MSASIFNPANGSLSARIQAWREVYRANQQLKDSMNLQDSAWLDRLGEKQDRIYAQKVIADSYLQATSSLSQNDLNQALESQLINQQDYHTIMVAKRSHQSKQQSQTLAERQNQQKR